MEYPHWLIVAGAVLVVLGFIGFALHKNDAEPAEDHLTRDTSSETIQAALENAEAAHEAKLKAKGKLPTTRPMRWCRQSPDRVARPRVGGPSNEPRHFPGKEKAERYATDPEYRASLVPRKAWEKTKGK